jgi:hypothetical protein
VQAYVQEGETGRWRYTGAFRSAGQLVPGAWNTLELTVPPEARSPLLELGVEFRTRGGWSGTAYIDAVRW